MSEWSAFLNQYDPDGTIASSLGNVIDESLQRYSGYTVYTKEMFDELAHIRESGAAMDREENELGVSCIAVPVFDIHGRVPYAVSISLSTSRLKQVGEKNLLKPLRETAQAISNELGFTVRDDLGAIT